MPKKWEYVEDVPIFQKLPKKQHKPSRKKNTLRAERKQKERIQRTNEDDNE
jgi:hypothetical protein